jgi:hypothetical protein
MITFFGSTGINLERILYCMVNSKQLKPTVNIFFQNDDTLLTLDGEDYNSFVQWAAAQNWDPKKIKCDEVYT